MNATDASMHQTASMKFATYGKTNLFATSMKLLLGSKRVVIENLQSVWAAKKQACFSIAIQDNFCIHLLPKKNFLTFFILDGTSTGDGKTIGLCPSFYTNYRCVSTGHCNVCRLINGVAEGCEIRSTTPVCDMDESTSGIQNTASRKVAKCVACTKAGDIPC